MMIFSLVAMIGLDKCCITSACLQWLCHSGERIVARGPLVLILYYCLYSSEVPHRGASVGPILMNTNNMLSGETRKYQKYFFENNALSGAMVTSY